VERPLTREARLVLELAREEACGLRHKKVRTEHLLLGVLACEHGLGARLLRARGLTLEETRAAVVRAAGRGEEELWAELIPFSGRSKKALEQAVREAISLDHDHVGPEHILLGILRDDDGAGAQILAGFGVGYERTRDALVGALVSARPRRREWLRRREVQVALACVAVVAAGVLVSRAFRAH
jgi:ATP-dependent Clp protease ATP-binding subunit ClpC